MFVQTFKTVSKHEGGSPENTPENPRLVILYWFTNLMGYFVEVNLCIKETLWSFFMDEASRLPSQSPGVLDTQLSTSEGWKTESTLEPLSAFKIGIPDKEYSFLTTRPLLHCSGILFFFSLEMKTNFRTQVLIYCCKCH